MNEIKELRKPAKRKGATRVIISSFKRNIYFIDLIDFSSKQDKWIQEVLGRQKKQECHRSHACDEGYHSDIRTTKAYLL